MWKFAFLWEVVIWCPICYFPLSRSSSFVRILFHNCRTNGFLQYLYPSFIFGYLANFSGIAELLCLFSSQFGAILVRLLLWLLLFSLASSFLWLFYCYWRGELWYYSLPALIHWIRNFFPFSLVVFNGQISTKHFKILSVRLFVISRHIYKIWKKKLPLKWNFLYPLFANCFHVERCSFTFLNVNFFTQL